MLFKNLISENETEIKSYMSWQNYDLNPTILPVVDLLKEHALMVLSKSFGKYEVEETILDELCSDVFVYFPVLMQQLSISRVMTGTSIVPVDILSEERIRTETTTSETNQNSELTVGTTNTDTNVIDTQTKSTGTVNVDRDSLTHNDTETTITNTSGIAMTGSKSVNLNNQMPEQALIGETGNFPVDTQGTPILTTAFVNTANQNFVTSNPVSTNETSAQNQENTITGTEGTLTTNDLTVDDTGTTTRTNVNSGSDNTESNTTTETTNTVTESVDRETTNAQYSYEISNFLNSTESVNAFRNWSDHFDWVIGIK